jgi:hypothetical protein
MKHCTDYFFGNKRFLVFHCVFPHMFLSVGRSELYLVLHSHVRFSMQLLCLVDVCVIFAIVNLAVCQILILLALGWKYGLDTVMETRK